MSTSVEWRVVDQASPEAVAALASYVAEIAARFPDGFDPGTPRPLDVFVLASLDGRTVGCGGLQDLGPEAGRRVGEVKRMWVDPGARGQGLGARLLAHLEQLARQRGHDAVRLDTNGALTEAIGLYERSGYRRIARYNENPYAELFFEKDLTTPTDRGRGRA